MLARVGISENNLNRQFVAARKASRGNPEPRGETSSGHEPLRDASKDKRLMFCGDAKYSEQVADLSQSLLVPEHPEHAVRGGSRSPHPRHGCPASSAEVGGQPGKQGHAGYTTYDFSAALLSVCCGVVIARLLPTAEPADRLNGLAVVGLRDDLVRCCRG